MLLAAVADGQIDAAEKQLLFTYKKLYPPLREISDEELEQQKSLLFNKLTAGMQVIHIIEEIGENLSEHDKNVAYALAVEVCASNFEMLPQEETVLKTMEKVWKIKKSVSSAVHISIGLRYQV